MDIVFTRSRDRSARTLVTRRDGGRLSVPVFGKLDPIPHDLAHYVVETELGLRDGFWASVAADALFEGMAIVEGRQRPHARERSRAVIAANHRGILLAEVLVGDVVLAAQGARMHSAPLAIEAPLATTRAEHDALLARLRPAFDAMCARWRAVPPGETLLAVWPDAPPRRRRRRTWSGGGRDARSAGTPLAPPV